MPPTFNPFARSRLKFEVRPTLIQRDYDSLADRHRLRYIIPRGSGIHGGLEKQFAIGGLLEVDDLRLVVESSSITYSNDDAFNTTVEVVALDFQAVLSGSTTPAIRRAANKPKGEPTPAQPVRFGHAPRRILS